MPPQTSPSSGAQCNGNQRSTREILWTCLFVIFSCTWTAVHPNVYGYASTQWQRTGRRILLSLLALLMPEVNVMWSVKQWLAAREITKRMNREREETGAWHHAGEVDLDNAEGGSSSIQLLPAQQNSVHTDCPLQGSAPGALPLLWTDVHSHFLQMGGYIFAFKEGHCYVNVVDLFRHTTSYEGMNTAAIREALYSRKDPEEELMDRSKSSPLARTIVYSQILWFGVNFIGRLVEGLTVTKLEVVSLAYIAMSLLAYFFWMNKPLDVDCPIIVREVAGGDFGTALASCQPELRPMKSLTSLGSGNYVSAILQNLSAIFSNAFRAFLNAATVLPRLFPMDPPNEWIFMDKNHPARYPPLAFTTLKWSPRSKLIDTLSISFYALFGGIHCIAWNFSFWSEEAQWWWRTSTLTIVVVPLLAPLLHAMAWLHKWNAVLSTVLLGLAWIPFGLGCVLYVPARIALLVLPFLELRSLPADALQSVYWGDFFPHIG